MTDPLLLLDWLAALLIVAGAFFSLVAGVGLFVLPDLLSRMHAAAKPQVLGLLLMLLGLAVLWRSWAWVPILLLAWVAQMVTAPVASHLVGRTGYRTKHAQHGLLHRDDLAAAARRVEAADGDAPRRRPRRPSAAQRREDAPHGPDRGGSPAG